MNQQEIDQLWDAHCKHSLQLGQEVICHDDFEKAAAEIRRQAFHEAADIVQHFVVAGNAARCLMPR